MIILAVDPGNIQSAYVLFDGKNIKEKAILPNAELLKKICALKESRDESMVMAIEMIASYGMAVGKEVFETCLYIGRFIEAWSGPFARVYRKDVKMFLCGVNNAKDSNIRQALIDMFGPGKDKAIGNKKNPGPLYSVSSDEWAALAVAVTFKFHLLPLLKNDVVFFGP